jgi:xylulokinase
MNSEAQKISIGSHGLRILPFGNGAERILGNKIIGEQFHNIDLNLHSEASIFRAVQEGIASAFRYELDIMRENGMHPQVIRAGKANLFLSDVFIEAFVNTTNVPVELYNSDGSVGAALGAGIGAGFYKSPHEAFREMKPLSITEPQKQNEYEAIYNDWKKILLKQLS